ncbi:MAG: hypothetical protein Q9170_002076 [Blastenia crenularia]
MKEGALATRLKALSSTIEEICKVSGCPGVSIGVIRGKTVVHVQGFGYRDVERKLPPDEHTIYYLASLSKTFTASMVANLVEKGRLSWTTPISQIVPKSRHWDATIREEANIVDYLSHRTGLAPKNNIWNQEFAQASLRREDAVDVANYLEKAAPFRSQHKYNNWGYALADEVVTALAEESSWGTALAKAIFEPLGMKRTITSRETTLDNRAEPYFALSDGTPYHLPRPFPEDGKIMQGAVGVQSSVHDLLLYYRALMEAAAAQTEHHSTSTQGNPLVQAEMLLKAHIPLSNEPSEHEKSYALGWARTVLPASTGVIGLNPTYVPEMPIIGKGLEKPELCIWHQGSNNTFLSAVFLLPGSQTAVVVLTNALANNDAADWIGQLLIEAVLDNPEPNDYLELARVSAKNSTARWPKIKTDLERERIPSTSAKPLECYTGKYYNQPKNFYLDIEHTGDNLTLCFQGNHEQRYVLEHYQDDTFSWVLTRDENARRGRFPVTWRAFYLLKFQSQTASDQINDLLWENDGAWPAGEIFSKEPSKTTIPTQL